MCQQHRTLPTTVQQDGDVSDAAAQQHWIVSYQDNKQEEHIDIQNLKGQFT